MSLVTGLTVLAALSFATPYNYGELRHGMWCTERKHLDTAIQMALKGRSDHVIEKSINNVARKKVCMFKATAAVETRRLEYVADIPGQKGLGIFHAHVAAVYESWVEDGKRMTWRRTINASYFTVQKVVQFAKLTALSKESHVSLAMLVTRATQCIARAVRSDSRFVEPAAADLLNEMIVTATSKCKTTIELLVEAHDGEFGPGSGEVFFMGPFLQHLPTAVERRIRGSPN